MRKRRRLGQDHKVEMDLTPMMDVVFILLIFFIVTTSFVKESGISVSRPSAVTAEKKERTSILIAISNQGEIWLQKRKINIQSVRANIERLHAENPEGSVVIQSDKEAQTGLLIKVMDQVRLAGVKNISISATIKN